MRRVNVNLLRPPVKPDGAIVVEQLYTVVLGNGFHPRFTSERDALAFQADVNRFLTDTLLRLNLLLADAFGAWRMAWPYFDEPTTTKLKPVDFAELFASATRSLQLATMATGSADYAARQWKLLGTCGRDLRDVAMCLERLYVTKTQAVPRHQAAELLRRANAVLDELAHFGSDASRAHSVHRTAQVYPF